MSLGQSRRRSVHYTGKLKSGPEDHLGMGELRPITGPQLHADRPIDTRAPPLCCLFRLSDHQFGDLFFIFPSLIRFGPIEHFDSLFSTLLINVGV